MKTKIKNKHQNINIEIDIENSIFSKNKMRTVGTNDKPQQQQPQVIQQLPQPMYNSRLPDEFNMYNAIMASRRLYELPVNREPYLPPAFQAAIPRPAAAQQQQQSVAQTPAPAVQSVQAPSSAPVAQTPVQQSVQQQPAQQMLSLTGPLGTPALNQSPPRSAPLTVQGSAAQPALVPVQNAQLTTQRNLSPPRGFRVVGYAPSPQSTNVLGYAPTNITQSMLYPLQEDQQVTQPVFQPMQAEDSTIPLVDLQLQNDEVVGGFRRPLTDAEEQKFVNNLSADQQRERAKHIEGIINGTKSVYAPTIKKYRLEKYVPNVRSKFSFTGA